MSSQFFNSFNIYQNALRRIGTNDTAWGDDVKQYCDPEADIKELVSATSNAEHNLSEVIDVSDSYSEILKMIM